MRGNGTTADPSQSSSDAAALELIGAVQRLSLARTVGEVQEIVRTTARSLCGADGATLVLRDGDQSWYVDEDAIEPLWKGQRFPLDACLGGWVILHREQLVVPDVSQDPRVPFHIYEPTFVRSLALVPIRATAPIGAIGNYWREPHAATADEVALLQALADATAVALENVSLWNAAEARVAERTASLKTALQQSEELVSTLAHELRNAVGSARGLLEFVLGDGALDVELREDVRLAHQSTVEALRIVEQQLALARRRARELEPDPEDVDLGALIEEFGRIYRVLRHNEAVRLVTDVTSGLRVHTDRHLLAQVLRNLVGNALKFTDHGEVRLTASPGPGADTVTVSVLDSGVGIAPDDLDRIFQRFAQVDAVQAGRPTGTGLGLPYVHRVVSLLGGRLEVESELGRGSAFHVVLPVAP